jgi:hypothetical protein
LGVVLTVLVLVLEMVDVLLDVLLLTGSCRSDGCRIDGGREVVVG